MQVLVTGGAGFIGSHLVDGLVEQGHEVRVFDNVSTGNTANVNTAAELVLGDVADAAAVAFALKDVEVVFHLAACKAVPRSIAEPLETDRTNSHGTLTVLHESMRAGVQRVISASSSSVYGGAGVSPTPETTPTNPKSPYAVSKMAAENYCRIYAELHELETVSLRYFNVFGPRQPPNSMYAAVIPRFIEALRERQPPTIYGDGLQSRDFTYVSDIVAANITAATAPSDVCQGDIYNIANGAEYTLLDLLETLSQILGVDANPIFEPRRPGDVLNSCADPSLARERLGYSCSVGLADGLAETVAWFEQGVSAVAV